MELQHPLDAALRERLKAAKPHQAEFSKAVGRSAGWLNKYMHGAGTATIDDAVRIVALLIGLETRPLSALELRLLKAFRWVAADRQEDAVAVFENIAKGYRTALPPGSVSPAARTPPGTLRKARGTR